VYGPIDALGGPDGWSEIVVTADELTQRTGFSLDYAPLIF
jgi:hypothetical protein